MSKLKSPDRNNKSTVFSDITKKFQGVVAGGAGGEQPAYTQLLHAAADGHVDVVRQLLQNGANVDAHDDVVSLILFHRMHISSNFTYFL